MPIRNLRFTSVGPFDEIDFEFDKRVNVFAGPNNCGKSVTLMVLAEVLVYPFTIPIKYLRGKDASYEIAYREQNRIRRISGPLPIRAEPKDKWKSHVKFLETVGYSTFVPALRHSTDFRAEGPGPRRRKKDKTLTDYTSIAGKMIRFEAPIEDLIGTKDFDFPELKRRSRLIRTEASLVKDEAIIQKIIDVDYMAYRLNKKSIRQVIEEIAQVASEITEGFPVQFAGVEEDEKGLFPKFLTPDGEMPLNCLSQGTQSIMQWLSHLVFGYAEYYDYPRSIRDKPGILIIDEIDAHLHPSWQKRIIPCLVEHFPNLQIFFSSHSPLMLAGLQAGQVHLLTREEDGKVSVTRNETDIIGWSADQILRSLMDVSSPTDFVTTQKIERLRFLRSRKRLSARQKTELEQLRLDLSEDLISGPEEAQIERFKRALRGKKDKK